VIKEINRLTAILSTLYRPTQLIESCACLERNRIVQVCSVQFVGNRWKNWRYKPLSGIDSLAAAAAQTSPLSHADTPGVTSTSVSLPTLTPCCCDNRRLDRRLDLRELCLPHFGCFSGAVSGVTEYRLSISSRRGTSFSSFFCRLRWARLSTNHNSHKQVNEIETVSQSQQQKTQLSKTINQSQQSHVGECDRQPITTTEDSGEQDY